MKKFNKTTFVIGSSIIVSSAAINTANADSNPFSVSDLSSGYMNVAEATSSQEAMGKMTEGKCGEGKCGENKAKSAMSKSIEAKCGANKAEASMEKSAATDKVSEGKCGEGKGKEGSCGGMMKTMSGWFE